jgi:hypothetical protein
VSGDTITVDVQTLLEAFLNTSPSSACFNYEACFLLNCKTSCFGTTLPTCWITRISKITGRWIKGILLFCFIQPSFILCNLFLCDFASMQLKNLHFFKFTR